METRARRVHIARASEDLDAQVSGILASFGLREKLSAGNHVIVKPNAVSDVPDYVRNGSNTSKEVLGAVLRTLAGFGANVTVAESETGTSVKGRRLERAFELMGVYQLQEELGFEVLNLTNDDHVAVSAPWAGRSQSLLLPRALLECDFVINVPKLKTHKYTTVTCALKNMFGAIPDPLRIKYHRQLDQVIAFINSLLWRKMFVVVDAIWAMEGAGPVYGSPVEMRLMLFSDNPIAIDKVACRIIGIDPSTVGHIAASERLFGGGRPEFVETGVAIQDVFRPLAPAHAGWFIKVEGELMRHGLTRNILFSGVFQKYVTWRLDPVLRRLRGGSSSWYLDEK